MSYPPPPAPPPHPPPLPTDPRHTHAIPHSLPPPSLYHNLCFIPCCAAPNPNPPSLGRCTYIWHQTHSQRCEAEGPASSPPPPPSQWQGTLLPLCLHHPLSPSLHRPPQHSPLRLSPRPARIRLSSCASRDPLSGYTQNSLFSPLPHPHGPPLLHAPPAQSPPPPPPPPPSLSPAAVQTLPCRLLGS